jgi:transcriptional regulator with XRE-family HTH domain
MPVKSTTNKIKELRTQRKLSRKDLALLLNVSVPAIGAYERGFREPNINKLKKMAIIFGVTVDDIIKY